MLRTKQSVLNSYIGALYKDFMLLRRCEHNIKLFTVVGGNCELVKVDVVDRYAERLSDISNKLAEWVKTPNESIDVSNDILDSLDTWERDLMTDAHGGGTEDAREIVSPERYISVILPMLTHVLLHVELHKCSTLFQLLQSCCVQLLGKVIPDILSAASAAIGNCQLSFPEWHAKFLDCYNAKEIESESEVVLAFKMNRKQVVFNDDELREIRQAEEDAQNRAREAAQRELRASQIKGIAEEIAAIDWRPPFRKERILELCNGSDTVSVYDAADMLEGLYAFLRFIYDLKLSANDTAYKDIPSDVAKAAAFLQDYFTDAGRNGVFYLTRETETASISVKHLHEALCALEVLTCMDVQTKETIDDTSVDAVNLVLSLA